MAWYLAPATLLLLAQVMDLESLPSSPHLCCACCAAQVVTNRYFEAFVLLLITASSVQLALQTHDLSPTSRLGQAMHVMDIFFCVAFGVEMVMKVVVLGLAFNGPGSYLRSPWNWLDTMVVVVQVVVLVVESVAAGASSFAWLRALRALRSVTLTILPLE
jgi:hypothetical protein